MNASGARRGRGHDGRRAQSVAKDESPPATVTPVLVAELFAEGQRMPVHVHVVVTTHLHFDDCGGNHLFPGRPIHVQRRELDDAKSQDDDTIRESREDPRSDSTVVPTSERAVVR